MARHGEDVLDRAPPFALGLVRPLIRSSYPLDPSKVLDGRCWQEVGSRGETGGWRGKGRRSRVGSVTRGLREDLRGRVRSQWVVCAVLDLGEFDPRDGHVHRSRRSHAVRRAVRKLRRREGRGGAQQSID